MPNQKPRAWYEGENRDALFYILIAIFFLEMIIGGVAFFYGIAKAAPETPGGPPMARFPWLGWAVAAISAPVAFLLIVHAAGSLLAGDATVENAADSHIVPERAKRFYAAVRHAPAIVILLAILVLGGSLFFIDGALRLLRDIGSAVAPYLPWIAGSVGGVAIVWILARAIFAYRCRKLELEHAWRREVLEKTGLVIAAKNCAIVADAKQSLPEAQSSAIPSDVIDVPSLNPGESDNGEVSENTESGANPDASSPDNS